MSKEREEEVRDARRLLAPLLPEQAEDLVAEDVAELYRARIDEILDEEGASQRGREARTAVAWEGPDAWMKLVADDAVEAELQLPVMPLPEGYRQGVAALDQLPKELSKRLNQELERWATFSGGPPPPHRIQLWRERVVHLRRGALHAWVGMHARHPLLVVRQRTKAQLAGGVAVTVLAGAGAGGFGLALHPFVGIGAFLMGSGIMGVTSFETLRKRYRPLWAHTSA